MRDGKRTEQVGYNILYINVPDFSTYFQHELLKAFSKDIALDNFNKFHK